MPERRRTFQPVETAVAGGGRYRESLAALNVAANRVLVRTVGHVEAQMARVLGEPIAGARHLILR